MTNFTSDTILALPLRYNGVKGRLCDALAHEEMRDHFII